MLLLLAPYLMYSYQKFGDPFWTVNITAKWFRNYEFVEVKRIGCEGCPTLEEFKRDSYTGQPITTFQYIFGMHSLSEVISRTIQGYADLLFLPNDLFWIQIGVTVFAFYYLYLLGLGFVVLSRYREFLLLLLVTINWTAFLVPIGYFDPRLVIYLAPFMTFAPVFAVWSLALWVVQGWKWLYHSKLSS